MPLSLGLDLESLERAGRHKAWRVLRAHADEAAARRAFHSNCAKSGAEPVSNLRNARSGPETGTRVEALQLFSERPDERCSGRRAEGGEMNGLRVLVPMTDSEIETLFRAARLSRAHRRSGLHGRDDRRFLVRALRGVGRSGRGRPA